MKIVDIKVFLWFFVIVALALSFPFQVMVSSPLPSLLPYIGILFIFAVTLRPGSREGGGLLRWKTGTPMDLLVSIYVVLVLLNTGWQTALGFITLVQATTAVFIYILPLAFFIYFRRLATEQESRSILMAIILVGLIVGIYYVSDSYSMLVDGRVSDFSLKAYEYSQLRAETEDVTEARISIGYRSHGLLEGHAVSAAWVALGCFAALTLLPQGATLMRVAVISTYGMALLIALNFTALVGFVVVISLMEFRGIALLRGRVSLRGIKSIALVASGFVLLGTLLLATTGNEMFEAIQKMLAFQVELATGGTTSGGLREQTYFGMMIEEFASFFVDALEFPPGFFIGDGFSVFGPAKGGDLGIVETLRRFGLPFFLAIIMGLISLIHRAARQISLAGGDPRMGSRYLWFAICVTIYLLFTEIHYTVWNAKSILPIFFLCLALYQRDLLPRRGTRTEFLKPSASVS